MGALECRALVRIERLIPSTTTIDRAIPTLPTSTSSGSTMVPRRESYESNHSEPPPFGNL